MGVEVFAESLCQFVPGGTVQALHASTATQLLVHLPHPSNGYRSCAHNAAVGGNGLN